MSKIKRTLVKENAVIMEQQSAAQKDYKDIALIQKVAYDNVKYMQRVGQQQQKINKYFDGIVDLQLKQLNEEFLKKFGDNGESALITNSSVDQHFICEKEGLLAAIPSISISMKEQKVQLITLYDGAPMTLSEIRMSPYP